MKAFEDWWYALPDAEVCKMGLTQAARAGALWAMEHAAEIAEKCEPWCLTAAAIRAAANPSTISNSSSAIRSAAQSDKGEG